MQVQSLQSELQFKEAEINEMKTKLLSSDRNKTASPLPRNRSAIIIIIANNRFDHVMHFIVLNLTAQTPLILCYISVD